MAILETGIGLIIIPTKDFKGVFDMINVSKKCKANAQFPFVSCDCNKDNIDADFPTLEFSLGVQTLSLRPRFYVFPD